MPLGLHRTTLLISLFAASIATAGEPAGPSLLSNGRFQIDADGDQWPDDWPHPDEATWEDEDGTHFVRLQSTKPGHMVLLYRRVQMPKPAPAALQLRLRLRYRDVKPGEKPYFDARLMGHFKTADGRTLKPEPRLPNFRGTSDGWVEWTGMMKVPVSADHLEIMPCLFQPAAGTLDLAQCELLAATAEQWAAVQPKIVPSETVVPSADAKLPPALHVQGNRLVTDDGSPVWLQGVCVDSLEWSARGEHLDESIPVAIEQWKANVIRLPVLDSFWCGRGPGQKRDDDGLAYRKVVDSLIEAAASRGAYVALDLHRFGGPQEEHVALWRDAAVRYKNHPAVLFELFNEPHGISWRLWRDGGPLELPRDKRRDPDRVEYTGETTVGMQALLDAVRGTCARNVVIAGGLDWSYDLSGVVDGHALTERDGGSGIVYSSHIYPWKSGWQKAVLDAARQHPIFIGEVGCPKSYDQFQFIPRAGRHSLEGWPEDVLGMIQANKLNWTAFSLHPRCAPELISDWNYTPTPYWGVYAKDALGGKQFELKKLR